jgi:hypothetical protein
VEYGDYQCRQCGEAYLEIEKLREVLGDRLRFVFRQYPYAKLHPQAELAAEAAEAAGAQGKFWEMHDLLFRRQDALRKKTPAQVRRNARPGSEAFLLGIEESNLPRPRPPGFPERRDETASPRDLVHFTKGTVT